MLNTWKGRVRFLQIQVAMETEVYIKLEINFCLCNLILNVKVIIKNYNWFNNIEFEMTKQKYVSKLITFY